MTTRDKDSDGLAAGSRVPPPQIERAMNLSVDWWSWKCSLCDFEAKSQFTVNPQQIIAESIVRNHIESHQPRVPPPQTALDGSWQQMADAAEMLWIVLANVSGGDWTQQSKDWREAAARWRDNYFNALRAVGSRLQPQEKEE